jgi:hypothetical protein
MSAATLSLYGPSFSFEKDAGAKEFLARLKMKAIAPQQHVSHQALKALSALQAHPKVGKAASLALQQLIDPMNTPDISQALGRLF